MTSLEIFEFKKTLQNYIQTIEIPEEIKRYVLRELLEEQEKLAFEELQREIQERDAKESEVTSDAESA